MATLPSGDASFYRYISLSNRANVVCSDTELERDRQALTKGLNMLSQNPALVLPRAIDDARHIYRIDLRELDWARAIDVGSRKFQDVWEAIAASDPYAVRFAGDAAASARRATGSAYPVLFADHLLDQALSGELYYAILGVLPGESLYDFATRSFDVDWAPELANGDVQRAATTRSRVSRGDILAERHEIASRRALWLLDNDYTNGGSSVFEDPFGYENITQVLFTLPNGLFGFLSVDMNALFASDPELSLDTLDYALPIDGAFVCSACHASGVSSIVDELRDVAERYFLEIGLDADEIELLRRIYPTAPALSDLIATDSSVHQQALSALQLPTTGSDPVAAAALRFVAPLTLEDAAAELGVAAEALASELPRVSAWLSPLETGTIERDRFMRGELQATPDPVGALDLDLLLTDALARVAYHAHYGKVDPERLDDTWNLEKGWEGKRGADAVLAFLHSPSLYAEIESLKPQRPLYGKLRDALARYRAYEAAGGWGKIPAGPTLVLGESDGRVSAVRHRLAVTEDLLPEFDNGAENLDQPLLEALERFQQRHALPSGKLDTQTVQALNLPPKVWIDRLRVNLERARWIMPVNDPTFVLVNIAAFEIYLVKDGQRVWQERVQVGRDVAQTPLFRDEIEYLVLNPTWTVPPSMLAETILPQAKKNPKYLRKRGLRVYDRKGREVAPESVNWRQYKASNLPYRLTQPAGAENALGAIKFMFPNRYYIYLHDTPHQSVFDEQLRTTSAGCIRVRNPLQLAELLAVDTKWTRDALDAQVKTSKTETVYLAKPVPVYLLYWTAEGAEDGSLRFHSDVYDRDPSVLDALNKAPRLRKESRRGAAD